MNGDKKTITGSNQLFINSSIFLKLSPYLVTESYTISIFIFKTGFLNIDSHSITVHVYMEQEEHILQK